MNTTTETIVVDDSCEVQNAREPSLPHRLTSASVITRNATLNIATEAWLALVLFASIPLLVRFLGEESFGLFSLAWVVIGYLAFLEIGVSTATTKFASEYLARQESARIGELVRTALAANCVMGVLAASVAACLAPWLIQHAFRIPQSLTKEALRVFVTVAFALPLLLIQGVLRATFSSFQRFDWINLVNGSVMSVQWVLMTSAAWKGYGIVAVVAIAVLARALVVIFYLLLLVRLVPDVFSKLSFSRTSLCRLLHFGAWVSVSQVISPVLVYLDRLMIGAMVSLSAVTIYTVPTEVFNRLGVFCSSLMATLFPLFSHQGALGEENGKTTRLFSQTSQYILLALCPLFAFLVVEARDILALWMGEGFAAESVLTFQILAVGAMVNFLARLAFVAVQALGRPDITGKFHLVELPLYAVLCVVLIHRWGIEGAALACTVRLWIDAFLMFWGAYKYCGLRIVWRRPNPWLLIGIPLLGCLLAGHFILREVWIRILVGLSLLLPAYAIIWIFALNSDDRPAIIRTIRLAFQGASR